MPPGVHFAISPDQDDDTVFKDEQEAVELPAHSVVLEVHLEVITHTSAEINLMKRLALSAATFHLYAGISHFFLTSTLSCRGCKTNFILSVCSPWALLTIQPLWD